MYVCVCNAVTESEVFRAIQAGVRSLRGLRDELGVASECGRCASCARACLNDAQRTKTGQPVLTNSPAPFPEAA